MSHLIASAPTRPPAFRDHDTIDHDTTDHIAQDDERARSRIWTLIEALAYAGGVHRPVRGPGRAAPPPGQGRGGAQCPLTGPTRCRW